MQIGTTRPEASILPLANAARSTAISPTTVTPLGDASPGMPETVASTAWPVNEQAFFEVWGSDDAMHDLDGSGVVDGADLGQWLSAQAAATSDTELQSLLDAWGTAGSEWDLNQDGIVDGSDLGIHLNGGVQNTSQSTAPVEADLSIEGFASAWGTSDAAYDLNADGIVDGADLGLFLNQPTTLGQEDGLMDRFMASWGTDDPEFDFNGDGIVDGTDLGHLLSEHEAGAQRLASQQSVDATVESLTRATMKRFDHGRNDMVSLRVFELAGGPNSALDPDGDGMLTRQEVSDLIRSRIDGLRNEDGLFDGPAIDQFARKWQNFTKPIEFGNQVLDFANQRRGMKVIGSVDVDAGSRTASNRAASRVADVLGKLGHEGIPSNLPTLLDRLSLPGTNSQAVMYELMQRSGIGSVEESA